MNAQKVRSSAIGITLIMLVLTGCDVSSDQPTASPTPDKIIVQERMEAECTCKNCVKVEAWLDQNENGKREPEEKPLRGVTFFADAGVRATSDATGLAIITVTGCDCDYFIVYPEVPPGYRLTTQKRLSNTACPRDEEWDSRCPMGTCSFGFFTPPATPRSLSEADLHGVDLQGEDLRGADLRGADLSEANLRGVNLSYADLSGAHLRGADLREANLWGANLSNADLSGADLRGADLRQALLLWPDLRGAQIDDTTRIEDRWRLVWKIASQGARGQDLSDAHLSFANLSEADLHGADLRRAVLSSAHMSKADLGEADLGGAYLIKADLRGADLRGTNLSEAALGEADLHGAKYDQDTRWPEGFDPSAAGAVLEE